jgi:hypothetical protein
MANFMNHPLPLPPMLCPVGQMSLDENIDTVDVLQFYSYQITKDF